MESYGQQLKNSRQEKYLDFDKISGDTSILRAYLEALEEEDESVFPGETYLKGYLKSYALYLGLDPERILLLYRNKKLQEALPPDDLLKKEKPKFLVPLIASLCSAVVVAGIVVFAVLMKAKIDRERMELALKNAYNPKKYELTEDPLREKLFQNDELVLGTSEGNIILKVATTNGKFGIETPSQGVQVVELSETSEIDVDGDGKPEIIVYVEDVSTNGLDRGAQVDVRLKSAENAVIVAPTDEAPTNRNWTEILTDNRAYPFTLSASVRKQTLFRYLMIPSSDMPTETIYQSGEQLTLTVRNGIRIALANGSAVSIKVLANSRTYEKIFGGQDFPGKDGEVVVKDIKWIRDSGGRYKLVVIDVD